MSDAAENTVERLQDREAPADPTPEVNAAEESTGLTMVSTNKRSLRNYFVASGFQVRYALVTGAIAGTLTLLLLFVFFFHTLSVLAKPNLFLSPEKAVATYDEVRTWGFLLLALLMLITTSSVVLALRHSHRIAGPIRRIDGFLDTLLSGRHDKRLILRNRDEFRELADKLNALAERLEELEGKK